MAGCSENFDAGFQEGYAEGHQEGYKCGLKAHNEDRPKYPQGLSPLHYAIELRDLIAMSIANAMVANAEMWAHVDLGNQVYTFTDEILEAREATRKQEKQNEQ